MKRTSRAICIALALVLALSLAACGSDANKDVDINALADELLNSATFGETMNPLESSVVLGLYACAEGFADNDLRMLTQYILRENKEALLRWPAALKLHHAMRGGLLYHTHTMLQAAKALCAVYKGIYPSLDADLVFAGIILHDVAKIPELSVGELGLASGYSTAGQLLGHINMGVAQVERAAAELMIDDTVKVLVQHILLSHHGMPDYGSPRSPMFPEAEIVSQVDVLDSRLFEMYEAISGVRPGEFSERQWALDNRQIYNHARPGASAEPEGSGE